MSGPRHREALVLFLLVLSPFRFAAAQQNPDRTKAFTFDTDSIGSPPVGFDFARTGQGPPGRWVVREERTARKNHVLVQETRDRTDYRYPLALVVGVEYRDVALSVRAWPMSGEVDQAFGLVWRYRDVRNYYVARCNANEDNCRIYRIVNGSRHLLQDKATLVAKKTWHVLKVDAAGHEFAVWLDGVKVLEATDDTFTDAGRVGLWTKADSVIQFDDFRIEGR